MAGRKKRAADLDRLDMTPLGDEVMERVTSGMSVKDICAELLIVRAAVLDWLEAPERREEVARARAQGAAVLIEESIAIADGQMPVVCPITQEVITEANRDRLRIQSRQWVAERVDRQRWGAPRHDVTVQVNVLHLDALRARAVRADSAEAIEDARIISQTELQPVDNSVGAALLSI
jgi:hypothetical protein